MQFRNPLSRSLFGSRADSSLSLSCRSLAVLRPTAASARQVSSPMHYEGRVPPRRAGVVSASPAAVRLAHRCAARPRAGPTFPPRAGALCLPALLEARSSTLRWVSGGPLPPHGAQRCVAAALPLERSPSRRRPVTARTFLRPSHPCCACTTARSLPPSTSPALGHALGWALPRLRRRGRAPGGNPRDFTALACPFHTEWSTSNGGASARAGGPGTR